MKVIAVGTLKPLTPEQQQQYMPTEVPDTLKLYLDGKIEQFWLRENMGGTIFLMNVDSVDDAKALLDALPLTAADLLTLSVGKLTADRHPAKTSDHHEQWVKRSRCLAGAFPPTQ